MTSATSTPGSVEATTALLQAELPRLEERKQALEKELVTVTERLDSVRTALTALQALSAAPPLPAPAVVDGESDTRPASSAGSDADAASESKATPEGHHEPGPSAVSEDTPEAVAIPSPRKARRTAAAKGSKAAPKAPAQQKKERPSKKATPAKSEKAQTARNAAPVEAKDGGRLIEQVMQVVSAAGGTPLRARDVTKALGRELTAGSINTVRSTLDRLVATSRAHRAGRGLYQAPAK
ncbi:hypothetical protein ACFU8W_21210 [Streptomyces sp. NPDC057565]|uniref:hypothetical protein n=1 Tax=Streptomyces sp. NPDC057565 TaxID=3346169 RepID=UPI00369F6DE0